MTQEISQETHDMPPERRTEQLLAHAREIGFDPVGVCRAEPAATFPAFAEWLDENLHDGDCCGMSWLLRHRNARHHPAAVLPNVKSLIVVGLSYSAVNPEVCSPSNQAVTWYGGFGLIAEYARGFDYHDVMRAKLRQLAKMHRTLFPHAKARIVVDTAPILEREYAAKAGLGWPGKNTMLINERHGSRFFLGLLLTTAELQASGFGLRTSGKRENTPPFSLTPYHLSLTADSLPPSQCDTCRRCIEACPTGAIATPYRLDARKCINYWSIEHPGNDIPHQIAAKIDNRLFGCDTCQCVCPFNRTEIGVPAKSAPVSPEELASRSLREQLKTGLMSLSQIEGLDENEFQCQFAGTPFVRLGLARLKRNAAVVREKALA